MISGPQVVKLLMKDIGAGPRFDRGPLSLEVHRQEEARYALTWEKNNVGLEVHIGIL